MSGFMLVPQPNLYASREVSKGVDSAPAALSSRQLALAISELTH